MLPREALQDPRIIRTEPIRFLQQPEGSSGVQGRLRLPGGADKLIRPRHGGPDGDRRGRDQQNEKVRERHDGRNVGGLLPGANATCW